MFARSIATARYQASGKVLEAAGIHQLRRTPAFDNVKGDFFFVWAGHMFQSTSFVFAQPARCGEFVSTEMKTAQVASFAIDAGVLLA